MINVATLKCHLKRFLFAISYIVSWFLQVFAKYSSLRVVPTIIRSSTMSLYNVQDIIWCIIEKTMTQKWGYWQQEQNSRLFLLNLRWGRGRYNRIYVKLLMPKNNVNDDSFSFCLLQFFSFSFINIVARQRTI